MFCFLIVCSNFFGTSLFVHSADHYSYYFYSASAIIAVNISTVPESKAMQAMQGKQAGEANQAEQSREPQKKQ